MLDELNSFTVRCDMHDICSLSLCSYRENDDSCCSSGGMLTKEKNKTDKRTCPLCCQVVRLSGCKAVRLSGCKAVRLSGCKAVRLSGCQVVRLPGCQVVRP